MKRPKISVIMNCYNGERYLREALDSVFAQTFTDFEVIFWDNASIDGSADIARSYREKPGGGKVRYFRGTETVSLGHARHFAIDEATGEYVAFLDTDDIWLPDFLAVQVALLESKPDVGLVYSDGFKIDGEGNVFGRFSELVKFKRGRVFGDLLAEVFLFGLNTLLVRRKLLLEVGKFNPVFNTCEDGDIYFKLAEVSEYDFSPEALVKYRYHDTNLSRDVDLTIREWLHLLDWWVINRPEVADDYGDRFMKKYFMLHSKRALYQLWSLCPLQSFYSIYRALASIGFNPAVLCRLIFEKIVK